MHVTAIIAAGGRGSASAAREPKQLLSVGGRPILERSVDAFASHPSVDALVVALPQALVDDPPAYFARQTPPRSDGSEAARNRCASSPAASGGRTRWRNAFQAAGATTDVIVIHDAARPFASADLIARTIAAAAESGAAVAAVQSRDTVKLAPVGELDDGASSDRRDAAARDDLPRADAAGVPARRAAARARARRARRRRGDRRSGAGRACGPAGPPRRRRGIEHQDHDARRSADGRGDRRAIRDAHRAVRRSCRLGPAVPAPATTCIVSSPGGR